MAQSQVGNYTPETNPIELQIYEQYDKEFKVTIEKMFNQLKENTDRQLNEIRKMMH